MKKYLFYTLAVILLLTGCGGETDTVDSEEITSINETEFVTEVEESETQPMEVSKKEPVVIDGIKISDIKAPEISTVEGTEPYFSVGDNNKERVEEAMDNIIPSIELMGDIYYDEYEHAIMIIPTYRDILGELERVSEGEPATEVWTDLVERVEATTSLFGSMADSEIRMIMVNPKEPSKAILAAAPYEVLYDIFEDIYIRGNSDNVEEAYIIQDIINEYNRVFTFKGDLDYDTDKEVFILELNNPHFLDDMYLWSEGRLSSFNDWENLILELFYVAGEAAILLGRETMFEVYAPELTNEPVIIITDEVLKYDVFNTFTDR